MTGIMENKEANPIKAHAVLFDQTSKLNETKQIVDQISQTDIDKSRSKGLRQSQPGVVTGKDNYYVRCPRCGGLVHWSSPICEKCLADPLKDPRETPRVSFRKTFMHDGLIATVYNMSGGGVQIKTKRPLFVGELLKIAFSLEDGMLRFGGIVVYVRFLSAGNLLAGVKFAELSARDSELLNRFLYSQSLKKHKNGAIRKVRQK